tara:strand:- start:135 stop:353 length:219 start_codon:yes stop_codon:yes gene_type:complete
MPSPQAQRINLYRRVLQLLGFGSSGTCKSSITETIERVDSMEKRMENIEAVTMSWSMDELTDEQKKAMGLTE